jgi:L-asparaginase II
MSVKLVEVIRSNLVESVHLGSLAVVRSDGSLLHGLGNVDRPTYFHSSAKPLQGIASLDTGIVEEFGLDLREIAVIISSHSGEREHIEVLGGLVKKIGVGIEDVECGISDPVGREVLRELYTAGHAISKLHCNCSGKHLGMLAACMVKGYPTKDYQRRDHPIQERIKRVITEFCGIASESAADGIDGCTVPVYAVPLRNMALAYANLCNPDFLDGKYKKSQNYVLSAMTMYPEYVAGKERLDTVLMKRFGSRVICKVGAEGVYCAGLIGRSTGIAVKIEDGALRAAPPAILEILRQLEVFNDEEAESLREFWKPSIFNNKGEVIGEIRPAFRL